MYASVSTVHAVNLPARVVCPQKANKDRHRFLVGTCSLHDANEISILDYHEDSHSIEAAAIYNHRDQIFAMEPSPQDSSLVISSWQSKVGDNGVTLWRMPHQRDFEINEMDPGALSGEHIDLETVCRFELGDVSSVSEIKWHNTRDSVLLGGDDGLSSHTITESQVKIVSTLKLGEGACSSSPCSGIALAWDPHSPATCALGVGTTLNFVDVRKMAITSSVAFAHEGNVRDVDYNPNKPLTLVTAGDDRKVKFWDARNMKKPIKTLCGHNHWVWRARFNPFHDQLLLSGGSDHLVTLWRIASCSSAPWVGADDLDADADTGGEGDPPDVKVRTMDQHEDSVYSVAWSPADAWVYCSLSFDGRVILNHVPSTEKYKILL